MIANTPPRASAAITLQVATHAIMWILIVSLEMMAESVIHGVSSPTQALTRALGLSIFSFACIWRLGKTPLLLDMQELHLYGIFIQLFALYLVWTNAPLRYFAYVEGVIIFLKFFRVLWIIPGRNRYSEVGWATFGILGYLRRRKADEPENTDRRVYYLILVSVLLSWFFNSMGFLLTYALIGAVVTLLISIFYKKIVSFLQKAEQDWIVAEQKLAVAQATAEINAQLSEKNEQLMMANRERDAMLADLRVRNECLRDASHDLAAPAFWITSCTQQLIQAKDDAARHDMALQLLDSVNYYNELLQSTIHSAKVMTKIDMPDLVPISVNKLADYLWAKYESIFQEKGLRFSIYKANQYLLEADGSVSVDAKAERTALNFHVACDEQILMRILNNLIMNALRNTSRGRVHVAFRKRNDGHCWVEVRDSGKGFEDADSADWSANFNSVAQRIQRGKVKANEAASHGLGINNMKNLCTSIGSTMLLRSRSGQGTLFRFVLPLVSLNEGQVGKHELTLNQGIL